MRSRIRTLDPLVPKSDGRTIRPPPSEGTIDPIYQSEQYKRWRAQVLRNAGYRCQAIENGSRCTKASPHHRMFADHIKELRDGGPAFDPANGQCQCGAHHTRKTVQSRA